MLVEIRGLKTRLGFRADNNPGYLTAPIGVIVSFVKHDHQNPIVLEESAGNQGIDVVAQPSIGSGEWAVVRVISEIGDDERVIRERVVG